MPDAKTIANGEVKAKRRFDARDFSWMAEFIIEEYHRRKGARKDREKQWDEIDRQIEMKPDVEFKKLPNGKIDTEKMWMAEVELPLQAQALEVLTADARRMMFAKGPWYRAHAEVTDKYLERVDFTNLLLGDENDVPSLITQDNADKLVEGFLNHNHRQYDFFSRWDRINAEAFKYGMGVGRARMEKKNVYIHEARGTRKEEQKIPMIVPISIRNLYLDDPLPSTHTSSSLGPGHIAVDNIKLENLQMAANKGSNNPDDEDGGWMPASVKALEPDRNGFVELFEFEGDLVVPRKTVRSLVVPGVIVTVAKGAARGDGKVSRAVVRFRKRKAPYSSYLLCPYHYEGSDDIYPTSPLMKGRPLQIMATDAVNRGMDSAALKNAPPVGYDKSNTSLNAEGGPQIHPYAQWPTMEDVEVYDKIGGDPAAMSANASLAINLYGELTGVLPSRIGAQTVSHTTAFAKDAELQRGATRTVDYVDATGEGALTRWLHMEYDMARQAFPSKLSYYIDAYGGFVEITKKDLPDKSSFEWFGAGGPAEEQQKMQSRQQAAQIAIQLDNLNIQLGGEPTLDVPDMIKSILRDGGWTDVDTITRAESVDDGAEAAPALPDDVAGNPATISTALQGIAFGGDQ